MPECDEPVHARGLCNPHYCEARRLAAEYLTAQKYPKATAWIRRLQDAIDADESLLESVRGLKRLIVGASGPRLRLICELSADEKDQLKEYLRNGGTSEGAVVQFGIVTAGIGGFRRHHGIGRAS